MTDNPIFAGPRHRIRRWRNYGMSMGFGARFLPTDIDGLLLWLDFSDISTLFTDVAKTIPITTDGDAIGAIEDKSGNGNDATQVIAGKRPLYRTGIQNGLSAGRWDGNDDELDSLTFTINFTSTHSLFVAYIGRGNGGGGLGRLMADGGTSIFIGSAGDLVSGLTNQIIHVNSGFPYTSIFSQILFGDGEEDGYENGVAQYQDIPLVIGPVTSTIVIGNRLAGVRATDGDILEVILYNSGLNTNFRQTVENYLNTKWTMF